MALNVEQILNVQLGIQGENLARTIEIDVSPFLKKWPDAEISLLVKRKKDAQPYVAGTSLKDGILYWPVTAADTEFAGEGKIEIRVISGDVVAKSATGKIFVQSSMIGDEMDTPEASQSWVNQVINASHEAKMSAQEAQEIVARLEEQGAPLFFVFITPNDDMSGGTADKTVSEIVEAVYKGKFVYAVIANNILVPPVAMFENNLLFAVHIPGEGDLAITMNGDNDVSIELLENSSVGASSGNILTVTISEDMTIDRSFEEILSTLDSGGMVYMLYGIGSNGGLILHPTYIAPDEGIAFVGEIMSFRLEVMLNFDGTITANDNLFGMKTKIEINRDESTGVYYVSASWNDTMIWDELALGKNLYVEMPGVGSVTYAGSIADASLSSSPTFEAHVWDTTANAFTFVQVRFLNEDYVTADGSYQRKVEVIRWRLPGERITEA